MEDSDFWKVSNKVDYTLATLMEVIQDCEKLGLEDKSIVAGALELYKFWKDNKKGTVRNA